MSSVHSGNTTCLCGAMSLSVKDASNTLGACHCTTCRRWGGGPLLAISAEKVEVNGDSLGVFHSSEWAERAFCKNCGTHLFTRLKANGLHFLPAGLFPEFSDLDFKSEIFIEEKPHYYDFANPTTKLTGAEVFAQSHPDA